MKSSSRFCVLFLSTLLIQISFPVFAQQRGQSVRNTNNRWALVIGNGSYETAPLNNAVNDARDMARALREMGFDVIESINQNRRQMTDAIRIFGEKLKAGGVGLFYFAGHGMQVDGKNYLIPTGSDIRSEGDIEFEAVDVNRVMRYMADAGNRPNIVILDACRNNPFARSFRSSTNGLAFMDAPGGMIIAYSTAPGRVASDGAERNGVYTAELLRQIRTPGLDIKDVFMRVTDSVERKTSRSQVPWQSISLTQPFYFIEGTAQINRPRPAESDIVIKKEQPVTKSIESNFFRFDLQECRASGGQLICDFLVHNTDDVDKELSIKPDLNNGGTRAWDNLGNSYSAKEVYLANNRRSALIPFGARVKVRISFSGVAQSVTLLSKIDIVGVAGQNRFNVSYRNICLIDDCSAASTNNRSGRILDTKSAAGFRFDLVVCRISGKELNCEWLITNTGTDDKRLWVYRDLDNGGSRAWDENGNSYSARVVTLANNENAGYVTFGAQPTLRIKFLSSVQGVGRISKIEIVGTAGDIRFRVEFRNINIEI